MAKPLSEASGQTEGVGPPIDAPAPESLAEVVDAEVPSVLGQALAAARPKEPIGHAFARARVAAGLFESSAATGVGRFQLLDRLGAGGMGVIYAAYDPQLERSVAVKLVHVQGTDAAGALAEAKALARLSHPNVVAIFDHGFVSDHLYIVMELVLGQTLKRWVRGRSFREIVRAYRQAAEGLAAAHAVALVHRDFKPENAIMGSDGRVRVVDFGLACESADLSTGGQAGHRIGGTPGYMAPEQLSGGPITAATDQYGFCTALQEGLRQQRGQTESPVLPRWVQAVIDRGRAADPAHRFPSMVDLLKELARDPATARRRWTFAGALVAAGVVAFGAGRSTWRAQEDICANGEARLARVWGNSGQEASLDRVVKLNSYGASLRPRLEKELNEHGRRWATGYRDVCLASARAAEPGGIAERRMACLEHGRAALKSLAEVIQTSDARSLPSVVLAASALPDPAACGDLAALLSEGEPPPAHLASRVAELRSQLAGARIQVAAGRGARVRGAIAETVAAARTLSYKPLLAEALLVEGHAILGTEDRAAAISPLTESYVTAFESGLLSLAVEAWARRAWAHGTTLGNADALSGLDVLEAIAANRSTSQFSRALLYNNVGCVHLALQRRESARAAFERASREAHGLTGPGAAELLNINENLGLVIDDPGRRDEVLRLAAADQSTILGDDHPDTLNTRWSRGRMTIGFARAIEIMLPACTGLQVHGDYRGAYCWLEVAFIRGELDDKHGAVAALERAASTKADSGDTLRVVDPYLHLWQGDAARAANEFVAAEASLRQNETQAWWYRFERADLQLGLGRALYSIGRLNGARRALSSSLAAFAEIANRDPSPLCSRRLGRTRAELAKVLRALHESSPIVSELALGAADWFRQAGGVEGEIIELQGMGQLRAGGGLPSQ